MGIVLPTTYAQNPGFWGDQKKMGRPQNLVKLFFVVLAGIE
jgi:hypothetical protein